MNNQRAGHAIGLRTLESLVKLLSVSLLVTPCPAVRIALVLAEIMVIRARNMLVLL
jgi:hypothetical protein